MTYRHDSAPYSGRAHQENSQNDKKKIKTLRTVGLRPPLLRFRLTFECNLIQSHFRRGVHVRSIGHRLRRILRSFIGCDYRTDWLFRRRCRSHLHGGRRFSPRAFYSVIGVFIAFSDVGIGTIVGSAVFNILFVIGHVRTLLQNCPC